jgi:hypothetical protein
VDLVHRRRGRSPVGARELGGDRRRFLCDEAQLQLDRVGRRGGRGTDRRVLGKRLGLAEEAGWEEWLNPLGQGRTLAGAAVTVGQGPDVREGR